jgi:quercetin 2,3-dioxygenase
MLTAGAAVTHAIAPGRRVYLLSTDGPIDVNGVDADAGDRVLAEGAGALAIRARAATEVFLVDLAR